MLLGLALEKATGEEMPKLLSEKVLRPLGLTNTTNSLTPEIPARHCTRSAPSAARSSRSPPAHRSTRRSTFWDPSWTITHGAIQTTNIYDMEATAVGIGSGKLLSTESYKKMVSTDLRGKTRKQPGCTTCDEMTEGYTYGLGIVISGNWLLQNPMFAGYARRRGVFAVAEDRDRRRRHLHAPEAFDDQGDYPQRGRHVVPPDRRRAGPR